MLHKTDCFVCATFPLKRMSGRKRKRRAKHLKDDDGTWCSGTDTAEEDLECDVDDNKDLHGSVSRMPEKDRLDLLK